MFDVMFFVAGRPMNIQIASSSVPTSNNSGRIASGGGRGSQRSFNTGGGQRPFNRYFIIHEYLENKDNCTKGMEG